MNIDPSLINEALSEKCPVSLTIMELFFSFCAQVHSKQKNNLTVPHLWEGSILKLNLVNFVIFERFWGVQWGIMGNVEIVISVFADNMIPAHKTRSVVYVTA